MKVVLFDTNIFVCPVAVSPMQRSGQEMNQVSCEMGSGVSVVCADCRGGGALQLSQ